jgi:hypothetical protein
MNLVQVLVDTGTGSSAGQTTIKDHWAAIRAGVWAAVYAGLVALINGLIPVFAGTQYTATLHGLNIPVSLVLTVVLRYALQYLTATQQ